MITRLIQVNWSSSLCITEENQQYHWHKTQILIFLDKNSIKDSNHVLQMIWSNDYVEPQSQHNNLSAYIYIIMFGINFWTDFFGEITL